MNPFRVSLSNQYMVSLTLSSYPLSATTTTDNGFFCYSCHNNWFEIYIVMSFVVGALLTFKLHIIIIICFRTSAVAVAVAAPIDSLAYFFLLFNLVLYVYV